MINSLFMLNSQCDLFMEKHWKSVISKSILDYFYECQSKCTRAEDIQAVIQTPNHNLIVIYRNKLYFVAVITNEAPPLFVLEFLHRTMDIFEDYFNECSENSIKENYVIVYELLDEMLDNGYPLATESNILKELIRPPNLFRKVANMVTGDTNLSQNLPIGQLSNIPWRRTGVKYANNEAYFDVIEEIDAIIDKNGSNIFYEIQGYIDCSIKLSGMPDLTLSFVNPRLLDDVSFHPCVRFKKWEGEKVLSFIPPDGNFRLVSYHIGSQNSNTIPIYVKHNIAFRDGSAGKFEVSIGPKKSIGKTIDNVSIEVQMPKTVMIMQLTPSQGKYTYDTVKKHLHWDIGKLDLDKIPSIKGNITLHSGAPLPESNPPIHVNFTISQYTVSGLKVNRLDMYGEKYKPFKGVKYLTKAGKFQMARLWIRTEPFINGAINYPITNHINTNTLRKTLNYAKNKGSSGYPKIEYSIWKYIACNKINIPEHVAWMYFETFMLVSNIQAEKRIEFDQDLLNSKTSEEIERKKDTRRVDLLQFILLLYIQQYYSVDIKSSFMSREDWPSTSRSDYGDKRKSKSIEEINHLQFITKNLDELLGLFQEKSSSSSMNDSLIHEDVLQAFSFLFDGSLTQNLSTVLPLHLIVKQSNLPRSDDGRLSVHALSTFIRNALELNPFEINGTLRNGRKMNASLIGGSSDPRKTGKIITNTNFAPKSDHMVILTQVAKQTIIEHGDLFRENAAHLSRCVNSSVYLLAPLKSCLIKKCRKSILFIGTVEKTLIVEGCVECTIISVCRRLIIKNSSMCTFHILTPTNPLILSGCDNLKLAPYNSTYPNIEKHAQISGLNESLNKWDKPIVVSQNQSTTGISWIPLSIDDFALFTVPIELLKVKSNQSSNPHAKKVFQEMVQKNESNYFGTLPIEYERGLQARHKTMEDNLRLINNANLTQEQRVVFQKFMDAAFKEWLQTSGNLKQLEQLTIMQAKQPHPNAS